LNNESTFYRDLAISCFDMNGISNKEKELALKERSQVLASFKISKHIQ